jgi:predicted nucleotidyltransferase
MPVRSLHSSVLRWPDRSTVEAAARQWARQVAAGRSDVVAVGWFGSYPAGNWGVGSDLDLVVVLEATLEPFERRAVGFDTTTLPVPADLLVYTRAEWERLAQRTGSKSFARQVEWLLGSP